MQQAKKDVRAGKNNDTKRSKAPPSANGKTALQAIREGGVGADLHTHSALQCDSGSDSVKIETDALKGKSKEGFLKPAGVDDSAAGRKTDVVQGARAKRALEGGDDAGGAGDEKKRKKKKKEKAVKIEE